MFRLAFACLTLWLMLNTPVIAQGTDTDLGQALDRYETGASRLITEWQIKKQVKVTLDGTSREFVSLHGSGRVQQWQQGFLLSLKHTPLWPPRPPISEKAFSSPGTREEEWVVLKHTPTAIIGGAMVHRRVPHATAQRFYGSGHGLNSALCTVVLLGMNPLRVLEKGYTVQEEGNLIRVKGRFLPDILVQQRVPEVELILDPAKGYAPIRMAANARTYTEEVHVLKWKQVGGTWIPQEVDVTERAHFGSNITTSRMNCRLTGVKRTSPQPPGWLSDDLLIEDARWGLPGITYRLKDGMPKIEDLKRMRERELEGKHNDRREVGWLKLSAPLLMIVVGIVWYWKLARTGTGR